MDITIESFDFAIPADEASARETPPLSLEEKLVDAARTGSDEAFSRLVELHQERVYQFCFRWLQNHEDALEITQDTFVRAYEAIPRYTPKSKFSTWLYQIALNLCRDHFKSRKAQQQRATRAIEGVRESICPGARPDQSAESSDQKIRVREAVEGLPNRLRCAVILFAFEELSQRDCAEILNCSERAIEGRLYRAREILAKRLGAASE